MTEQNTAKTLQALNAVGKVLDDARLTKDETMSVVVSLISHLIVHHSDWTVEYVMKQLTESVGSGVANIAAKRVIQ